MPALRRWRTVKHVSAREISGFLLPKCGKRCIFVALIVNNESMSEKETPLFEVMTMEEKPLDFSDISVLKRQYNASYRQLKHFGLRYLPDDEQAVEDLIQDTWLRIWERKGRYKSEASFRRYVTMSLYNAIMNRLRHERVVHEYESMERGSASKAEEEVSLSIIKSEVYAALNSVFDELPDSCRRVYAANLEGKSHKEIAEMFNISVNTVKKHINNANHYMRRRLKDFMLWLMSAMY